MSSAAKSVFVFGIYLAGLGAALLAVPNLVIGMFGFPATSEVWIRVVGVLVLCLAYYYIQAAQADHLDFCRWTVHVRTGVFLGFAALAALRLARPTLVLFGVVDLLGAVWTAAELRRRAA